LDGTTEQELGVWRPNGLLGVEVDPTGTWLVALQGGRILQQRLDALEAPPRDLGTYAGEVSLRVGPWRDRAVLRDASGEVRVWDLPSGRLLHAVKSPAGVRTLALHPEGRFLATGPWLWLPPRSMFLFDLSAPAAAEPTPLLQIPVNVLLGMTFSPDGVWLTSEHRRVALLWNTSGRHPVVLGRGERPVVCFDEDGHLLTGGNEGVLRRWFLDPGAAEAVEELWSRPDSQITWLEPAPGGRSVAVRDGSGYTRVVIVPLDGSGTTITEPERPPEPPEAYLNASDLAWHPSGGSFAVFEVSWVRPDLNGIRVLDLATGIRRTLDTHVVDGGGCDDGDLQLGRASPVWLPDGRLLSDGVAGLRLWDLETGTSRLLQPCRRTEWHIRLLATPDSRALVRLDLPSEMAMPSSLSVRDLGSGETREIISHGNHVTDAALDPSGTILATGDASGVIRVGRLTGEEPHLLFGHTGTVLRVAVSPDGSRIASGSADGTIRLWPMPDLSKPPLHTLPHDELLAKLHSLTNLRAVPDPDSDTGWTIEIGPFPGWREVPTW
jgi:WD40 repeat protein